MFMRQKRNRGSGENPGWLNTYADTVTILLIVFVLMFSVSTINADKWSMLVQSLTGRPAGQQQTVSDAAAEVIETDESQPDEPAEASSAAIQDTSDIPASAAQVKTFDGLYLYFKQYIRQNHLEDDMEIGKGDGFTFLTFRSDIFFDADSSNLKSQGKKILDDLAEALENINNQVGAVRFEGHTARISSTDDESDSSASRYDWQLSSQRAVNALYYLYSKDAVDPSKLTATGHGDHKPLLPYDGTEESRTKNRRIEIYIGKAGADELSLDEVYEILYGISSTAGTSSTE